jgi:hypothetical protein
MKCDRVQLPELLRGDLSEEDSGPVLAHLEECPSCRERARLMALLQGSPSLLAGKAPGRRRFHLALAAAFFLAVVGVGIHVRVQRLAPAYEAHRLATTVPYPLVALTTRSTGPEEDGREQAFSRYALRDFAGAAEGFSSLELAAADPDVQFFWGVASYLSDDLPSARRSLERAAELSERWVEPSLWYLANLELKSGDLEAARNRLESLRAAPGQFRTAADRLLEELTRPR